MTNDIGFRLSQRLAADVNFLFGLWILLVF
jgi:hypothetical protein